MTSSQALTHLSPQAFFSAHATAPQWQTALELVLAQLQGQASEAKRGLGNTGFLYFTDALAPFASEMLTMLKVRTGMLQWVGASSPVIYGGAVQYSQEPALAVMTGAFPRGSVQLFSPNAPLLPLNETTTDFAPRSFSGGVAQDFALIDAASGTPYLTDLLLDVRSRLVAGQLFGGIAAGNNGESGEGGCHIAASASGGVYAQGLSGAVFASDVDVRVEISHGCYPINPSAAPWKVLEADGHWIMALARNGRAESAFTVLLKELGVLLGDEDIKNLDPDALRKALSQGIFIAKQHASPQTQAFSRLRDAGYTIRNLVGIDPQRGAIMVSESLQNNDRLQFCRRNGQAAKTDLIRAATSLRADLEEEGLKIKGAVLISCLGRGEALFGAPNVEPQTLQKALGGNIPLIGFAAAGEIAGSTLHGFTAVLAVFT